MILRIFALMAALGSAALPAVAEPALKQVSDVVWTQNEGWFGGFSGMEVSDDGKRAYIVSDRGRIVTAGLIRDGLDTLAAIQVLDTHPLRSPAGSVLGKPDSDAEGLAEGPDGQLYVSFENDHRVMRIDPKTGRTGVLPRSRAFKGFPVNQGLEALAITPGGTLHAIPESSTSRTAPFSVYALERGRWRRVHRLIRRGAFVPVGADYDHEGRLYLLERSVTPLGFRSRIRRFEFQGPVPEEVTLITSLPSRFDNLEAISVWKDRFGQTRLTTISDDNFLPIQSTRMTEFIVTE